MSHGPQPMIRHVGDGVVFEIGPTRNTVRLKGEESGGHVGVIEMELAPGFTGPPLHKHLQIDHIWYVLSGSVQVEIAGQDHVLEAGSSAFIPRQVVHTFANTGREIARVLAIDTPRTLDRYFEELAVAIPGGAAVTPQLVADIQRRHDTVPQIGGGTTNHD